MVRAARACAGDCAKGRERTEANNGRINGILSEAHRRSRLLLLHHNTPGVLATVNGLLADHGVNIVGQLLSTRGTLGYVVTDIAADTTPDVVAALEALPETVRLRVQS